MTGEEVVTAFALLWQRAVFVLSKGSLTLTVHHLCQRAVADVAKFVLGKYKVVARIHVTVVFHHAGMPTFSGHGAQAALHAHPVGQGGVKQLHESRTHIVAYPLVENSAKKVSPLLGRNREVSQLCLRVISHGCQMPPVGMGRYPFDDWCELQVVATYVLEELIEIEWIVGIEVVDHGHGVPFYLMFVQAVDASHHLTP